MINRYVKIENEHSFVKDTVSSALINTDLHMLAEHKNKKQQKKIIENLQYEIVLLKEQLTAIKTHLNLE